MTILVLQMIGLIAVTVFIFCRVCNKMDSFPVSEKTRQRYQ